MAWKEAIIVPTKIFIWVTPEEKILGKSNVAVVQGSAFGLDGYFRISYATSMKNLKKAMERIKSFCDSL